MTELISEQHTRIFESLKIGLAITSMDGSLIYVNQAYADLIGYDKKEIHNLSYWDITPKKYDKDEQEQLEKIALNKKYGPFDKEYIHKSGDLIPVRLHGEIVDIEGTDYLCSTVENTTFSMSKGTQIELESKSRLIEESQNGIFIFDASSLKFLYANKSAISNIGYELTELEEMSPVDIKPELSHEQFLSLLEPLIDNSTTNLTFETTHQRKDGTRYCAEILLQKTTYLSLPAYSAFINDVTVQKETEEKRARALEALDYSLSYQKAIQDNAAYSIVATDTKGIITHFNKTAQTILQYSAEEVVGLESPALFHDPDETIRRSGEFSKLLGRKIEPGFETFICITNAGMPNSYEWTYVRKDGRRLPVLLSITSIIDKGANISGYLGIAYDITDKKKEEQELENAKREAEEALFTKSQFLANMSHEVRTPMNGILGMTQLLQEDITDPAHLEKLGFMEQSAHSLLSVIDDILDISKIEANKVEIESIGFDLENLIKEVVEIYKNLAAVKRIELEYKMSENTPKWIESDPFRIRQILNNLLSNAIKFTSSGNVKVELSFLSKEPSPMLQISVQDTGIGMDQAEQKKVFSSFSQADASTTRRFGGTGLGLTISKDLAELMDGDLGLESKKGAGSIFTLTIPVKVAKELKKTSTAITTLALKKHRLDILAVEDVQINQKVIAGLITKMGQNVTIANNGLEAVELIDKHRFDIVLMDCHMPILDGFEATKRIVAKHKDDRPYIVALTASAMKEDVDKCYASGMDSFLAKPLDKGKLFDLLSNRIDEKQKLVNRAQTDLS